MCTHLAPCPAHMHKWQVYSTDSGFINGSVYVNSSTPHSEVLTQPLLLHKQCFIPFIHLTRPCFLNSRIFVCHSSPVNINSSLFAISNS